MTAFAYQLRIVNQFLNIKRIIFNCFLWYETVKYPISSVLSYKNGKKELSESILFEKVPLGQESVTFGLHKNIESGLIYFNISRDE